MSKYKFILNKELKQKLLAEGINPRRWKDKHKPVIEKYIRNYRKSTLEETLDNLAKIYPVERNE